MRNLIFFVLLTGCLLSAQAQNKYTTEKKSAIKNYEEGIRYLNLRYYNQAIELFKKAIYADQSPVFSL